MAIKIIDRYKETTKLDNILDGETFECKEGVYMVLYYVDTPPANNYRAVLNLETGRITQMHNSRCITPINCEIYMRVKKMKEFYEDEDFLEAKPCPMCGRMREPYTEEYNENVCDRCYWGDEYIEEDAPIKSISEQLRERGMSEWDFFEYGKRR